MECPVCYCDTNLVQLTCGHTLCASCTKKWYLQHRGCATCPMCRQSLCFRNIVHKKRLWNAERCHQLYTEFIDELIFDCTEEYFPFLLQCMSIIQDRYTFTMKSYPDVTSDAMEFILRYSWIPLEPEDVYNHDIPTFMHYLFVNRTEYHNLSSSQYVKFQVEMDLFHKLIDLIDRNSEKIPDGDYLQMCDTIKQLRDRVNPPSFLLDQNQPLWVGERPSRDFLISGPVYRPTVPMSDGQPREWIEDSLPSDPDTTNQRDREQLHQRWREVDEEVEYPGLNEFLRELHEEWSET
jgi:hypothetical protein